MKSVKVYGPGCKRCETTEAMVKDAAARLGIDVVVEKVTDPKSIAMAGVMSTPGISVDGIQGSTPYLSFSFGTITFFSV